MTMLASNPFEPGLASLVVACSRTPPNGLVHKLSPNALIYQSFGGAHSRLCSEAKATFAYAFDVLKIRDVVVIDHQGCSFCGCIPHGSGVAARLESLSANFAQKLRLVVDDLGQSEAGIASLRIRFVWQERDGGCYEWIRERAELVPIDLAHEADIAGSNLWSRCCA